MGTLAVTRREILRLLRHVRKDENGCWLLLRSLDKDGYPFAKWRGRQYRASRLFWYIYQGMIPARWTIDHLCRVHACVNPDHLEPVTSKVNTLRGEGITAQNAKKVCCMHGHALTEENTYNIRDDGGKTVERRCRICYRRRWHKWNDKHKGANIG